MAPGVDAAGRMAGPWKVNGGMKQRHELRAKEGVHHLVLLVVRNSGKDVGPQPVRDSATNTRPVKAVSQSSAMKPRSIGF